MRKNIPLKQIDETDHALLSMLQKDGRTTNVKIAGSLNLSETPCWRRLKRLEDTGFIEGYHAVLNRKLLGFGIYAFVQIFSESHTDDSLEQFEQTNTPTCACHNPYESICKSTLIVIFSILPGYTEIGVCACLCLLTP